MLIQCSFLLWVTSHKGWKPFALILSTALSKYLSKENFNLHSKADLYVYKMNIDEKKNVVK